MAGGTGLFPEQRRVSHPKLQFLLDARVAGETERGLGGYQVGCCTGVTGSAIPFLVGRMNLLVGQARTSGCVRGMAGGTIG